MDPQKAAIRITARIEDNWSYQRDPDGKTVEHAYWMLLGIAGGYIQGEKAHRWLGYAQGILVSEGVVELEEMKRINKIS